MEEDKQNEINEYKKELEEQKEAETQNQIRTVKLKCLDKAQEVLNLLEEYYNDDRFYKRTVLMIWNANQQENNDHNQGCQTQKNIILNSVEETEASTRSLANRIN